MSKIIYQSQEMCQDYLIDQDTQQLLAYLYLFGSTHPREVANRLDYENEDAVVESVNDVLCEDKMVVLCLKYPQMIMSLKYP